MYQIRFRQIFCTFKTTNCARFALYTTHACDDTANLYNLADLAIMDLSTNADLLWDLGDCFWLPGLYICVNLTCYGLSVYLKAGLARILFCALEQTNTVHASQ